MTTFPDLAPAAAPITPGTWPATAHQSLSGGRSIIRHGSAEIGRRLQLSFVALTQEEFLWIRNHYRGHRSNFDSFDFSATTLAADQTPTGTAWRWAGPPQIVDQHADVFNVSCEFVATIRKIVRLPGAAWASPAGAFTPGAITGIIQRFVTGLSWATSSTTLSPGTFIVGDPYASSVSLLLHLDGSNNSTTFTDSSANAFTVTGYGDAKLTTTDPKFGSACLTLDGGGDYLQTPADAKFALGTGDFTVECWAYINSGNTNAGLFTFGGTSSGLALAIYYGDWRVTTSGSDGTTMGSVTTGAWQHFAVTRNGSNLRLFVDGTQLGSTLTNSTNLSDDQLKIGYYYSNAYAINAKIDEFRVTKGVARYTSSFTPDNAPF